MDRFDAMAVLIAAVDGGSLSAASRALGMPLPTVSRKISDLEDRLGAQLVVRTSRKLLVTEAGRAYVADAHRILELVDEAERAASGEYRVPQGRLTITAPIMFGRLHVQPVILDFLAAQARIAVRLGLADRVIDLINERVDAAVRIGALPDSSLVATRLGAVRWVTCASPAYLEAHGEPATPEDLANHHTILFEGLYAADAWTFGLGRKARSVAIRPRLAVNSADAAIAAATASTGITRVLSYQVAGAIAAGTLRRLLRTFEPEPLPVHLIHAGQPLLPLKLRAFLDFAGPRLKAALATV